MVQVVQHGDHNHKKEPGAIGEAVDLSTVQAAAVCGDGAIEDGRDLERGLHLHRAGELVSLVTLSVLLGCFSNFVDS